MTAFSEKAVWLLNRLAAAIVTAALTGLLAGVALELVLSASILMPGSPGPGPGANLIGGALWLFTMAVGFGAIVGVIPGTLIMCFSSAKTTPWRSIPKILVGTVLGWIVCAMPFWFLYGSERNAILGNIGSVVGPTIGAILALRFWPKRGTGGAQSPQPKRSPTVPSETAKSQASKT